MKKTKTKSDCENEIEDCNDFCIIGKQFEDGMKYIHFRSLSYVALPEKEGAHQVKCKDVNKFLKCLRGFTGYFSIPASD